MDRVLYFYLYFVNSFNNIKVEKCLILSTFKGSKQSNYLAVTLFKTACAAASLAIGTRNGEQDT